MLVTFLWFGFFETEFLFPETGFLASDFLSQPEENPGAETRIQLVKDLTHKYEDLTVISKPKHHSSHCNPSTVGVETGGSKDSVASQSYQMVSSRFRKAPTSKVRCRAIEEDAHH